MKFRATFLVFSVIFALTLTATAQKDKNRTKTDKHKSKTSLSTFELGVIKEINLARTHPQKYQNKIEEQKKYLRGKIMIVPNQPRFLTFEGAAVMNEAIRYLGKVSGLKPFIFSKGLSHAARHQLKDLKENPDLGHTGKDGSHFSQRMAKFGKVGKAGENITYTDKTPEQVVLRMLIDDGVEPRNHRKNVLSMYFTKIGVACGEGKKSGFICVVIFAERFETTNKNKPKAYEFKTKP